MQYAGPPPAKWAGDAVNAVTPNPHGLTIFGSDAIIPGGLFSAILGTTAPQAVNVILPMSGLSIPAPTGSYVEIGLTLYYDEA